MYLPRFPTITEVYSTNISKIVKIKLLGSHVPQTEIKRTNRRTKLSNTIAGSDSKRIFFICEKSISVSSFLLNSIEQGKSAFSFV